MKLRIYKKNNKYAFSVDGFYSEKHHVLVNGVEPKYLYASDAFRDAKKLAATKPYHIEAIKVIKTATYEDLTKPVVSDASAEDLIVDHYKAMLDSMSKKVVGIDNNTEEEKELTYQVLKQQVEELLRVSEALESEEESKEIKGLISGYRKIAQKHFREYLKKDKKEDLEKPAEDVGPPVPNMPPEEGSPDAPNLTLASNNRNHKMEDSEVEELMDYYGMKACEALKKCHPDVISKNKVTDNCIEILSLDKGKVLFKITINGNSNVNNILPQKDISEFYPSYSHKFYQKYWKPIVESIGHFFLDEMNALIVPGIGALPDMPAKRGSFQFKGWSPVEGKLIPLEVSFKDEGKPIWAIACGQKIKRDANKVTERYTVNDFMENQPARVRCIDDALDLNGKIGEVVQINEFDETFELDINFGRKIVRLLPSQVEILDEI